MFQFPGLTFTRYSFTISGFPIRTSTDQKLFALPRSFSQLTTSFIVSWSLGIPHTLLFASYPYYARSRFSTPNLSMNFQPIILRQLIAVLAIRYRTGQDPQTDIALYNINTEV